MKIDVKVNTNQLNKTLKASERRVERVALEALIEASREGVDFARGEYAKSHYDGENDVKVSSPKVSGKRTVKVTFSGEAFPFIEWGTGSYRTPGYINTKLAVRLNKTKVGPGGSISYKAGAPDYWYFTSKGRKIKGKHATYKVGGYSRYYYIGPRSHKKHYVSIGNENLLWGDDDKMYFPSSGLGAYSRIGKGGVLKEGYKEPPKWEIHEEEVPEETREKADSYITRGNAAADVLPKFRQMVAENIHKKYGAKIK